MPDPRVVYMVAAVVVLALVVWVVVVLVRPPSEPQALPDVTPGTPAKPSSPPVAGDDKTEASGPPISAKPTTKPESRESLLRSRPRLDSHLEIKDHPEDGDGEG
jgi:hypothetical protein